MKNSPYFFILITLVIFSCNNNPLNYNDTMAKSAMQNTIKSHANNPDDVTFVEQNSTEKTSKDSIWTFTGYVKMRNTAGYLVKMRYNISIKWLGGTWSYPNYQVKFYNLYE